MVIINWKLRPKGHKLNLYVKYKNDPNLFSLKVNHGGGFSYVYGPKRTRAARLVYKGGDADWFDDVDADGLSVIEVSGHNSRSCKGQRGGQSTGTPMPNQGPSTPTVNFNPSAEHNMTHFAPHVTVNPSAQSNVTQSTPP
nr:transposase, MuDR [Tanacetum cinerariifolium]